MRVYRHNKKYKPVLKSSLTVCEGISGLNYRLLPGYKFPHCMWEYIAAARRYVMRISVPSLYVRVYRIVLHSVVIKTRSLTVCEGISNTDCRLRKSRRFPHCMWGYIELDYNPARAESVPSLYVRVYRFIHFFFLLFFCSLTVCEGISTVSELFAEWLQFPHCMWGCIDETLVCIR